MTLTIEIPDSETDVINAISNIVKNAGGNILFDDDNLTQAEFDLLKESAKEIQLIKKGVIKGIPASELWND